ncbi:MAG: hypothetical protein HY720_21685 [Planctomycetes bacterium]|nr:hypothetical protein [Planctomycetota bacterium]
MKRAALAALLAAFAAGCAAQRSGARLGAPGSGSPRIEHIEKDPGLFVEIEPADEIPPFARHRLGVLNTGRQTIAVEGVDLLDESKASRTRFLVLAADGGEPTQRLIGPGEREDYELILGETSSVPPWDRGWLRIRYLYDLQMRRAEFIDVPVQVLPGKE